MLWQYFLTHSSASLKCNFKCSCKYGVENLTVFFLWGMTVASKSLWHCLIHSCIQTDTKNTVVQTYGDPEKPTAKWSGFEPDPCKYGHVHSSDLPLWRWLFCKATVQHTAGNINDAARSLSLEKCGIEGRSSGAKMCFTHSLHLAIKKSWSTENNLCWTFSTVGS